jgi:tetratricopeptide (TPR) repeat protein
VAEVDFFVSHAGRDEAWAEWVAWHLLDAGYTVELDCWDWAAGENFIAKMHKALSAANRVVALLSPAYFEDLRYTTEEWTAALVKNDEGGRRLVPVQVEPCVVPPLLRTLMRVELFDVDEAEAARLARCRRVLGDDDPDTLHAAHHLATCLYFVGEFEQARRLSADTLDRRRRMLGDDHIDVQRSASRLATNLRELGKAETARQLHEAVLAQRQRSLGNDHPATINTADRLGCDLYALGQADAARRLHEDSLTRARRVLGEDHLCTMNCANDLARDVYALAEFEAARYLGEDTLARARRILGEESYLTIDITNNLAAALQALD